MSGAGTAGHVYPALAVADVLIRKAGIQRQDLLYVGSTTGLERDLVERFGLPYVGLNLDGGLRGKGLAAAANAVKMILALFQALRLLGHYRPQAIMATGGYGCVPVVLAGWMCGVPSLVYLPDVEPGWAVRFLAPFARRIALTVSESAAFFPKGKTVVTGYPVRAAILTAERAAARRHFGFLPEDKVLLVFGGSRGARKINTVIAGAALHLLAFCHVIHICGAANIDELAEQRSRLPEAIKGRYRLYAYLHEEMPLALAGADLAISRAGASVLGELPAVGLPAILVPYTGGHRDQVINAAYLARHGGAIVIPDDALQPDNLVSAVCSLFEEQARLERMRSAMKALARPEAADLLAQEVVHLS